MIASLTGTVAAVGLDHAVLDVGGVGLSCAATPATLSALRVGERAHLHTSLVVREDSLTLFGFRDEDERTVFHTLQSVTGIGPRLALAVLAVLSPNDLRRAIAADDLVALQRVPGVGRKVAQRLVLELAGKVGAPLDEVPAPAAVDDEVVAALTALGWAARDAATAVDAVSDPAKDRAETLRAALQHLGRSHG